MQRDLTYMEDILIAARLALQYLGDKTLEQFLEDGQCQDAVVRRIEIMGEAVRRISDDVKRQFPQVPWDEFRRMRNEMIHEYEEVDFYFLYDFIQANFPNWIPELEKILSDN